MIPLTNPTSHYDDDYHSHSFFTEEGDLICVIEFDGIEEGRNGALDCDVVVTWSLGQRDARPVILERGNLMVRNSGNMARILKRLEAGNFVANWQQGFDIVVYDSVMRWRGDASSDGSFLFTSEPQPGDSPFLLEPWISSTGVTALFAPPGSNKSMLSLRFSLAVGMNAELWGHKPKNSGPVIYVDFEDEQRTHELRLSAIARSLGLEATDVDGLIYYVQASRSMRATRRKVRKLVRDLGAVLVVVDSMSRARGTDVSDSGANLKVFEMFAQFGAPVLVVDHMTKEENKRVNKGTYDAREAQPLGSVTTQNSLRLAWFMNKLPSDEPFVNRFNLSNTKHNNVPYQEPKGLVIKLGADEHGNIMKVEFTLSNETFNVSQLDIVRKMTNQEKLLLWHFRQQRGDGQVIPMTLTDMKKSGVSYGTITSTVTTKKSQWWEKMKGSKQYILSPDGMERATFIAAFTPKGGE